MGRDVAIADHGVVLLCDHGTVRNEQGSERFVTSTAPPRSEPDRVAKVPDIRSCQPVRAHGAIARRSRAIAG
jgi:hypothetical protein